MRRFDQIMTTAAALLALAGSSADAQGSTQPAPWTSVGTRLYATGPDVWVRFFGADAGYASSLAFICTLRSSCEQLLFENHDSGAVGDEVKLAHTFDIGEEVIFRLAVASTGDAWYTGSRWRNDDRVAHFATQSIFAPTQTATYSLLGGFEDLRGGGDRDYNDLMFQVSNVSATPMTATPEPASLLLTATGLAGLGAGVWQRRRRRRAD